MKKATFPEGSVCKPCWELKYCPYGYLVEFFPLSHADNSSDAEPLNIKDIYKNLLEEIFTEKGKNVSEIHDLFQRLSVFEPEANEFITQFAPEDVACRIFGHACPVFFVQSGATETKEARREGRYIPRPIMMKVVRRDNHICQSCNNYVRDDEIEFDHIIPVSKGGPTNVDNLRLLCRRCNRKKSNSLNELLDI